MEVAPVYGEHQQNLGMPCAPAFMAETWRESIQYNRLYSEYTYSNIKWSWLPMKYVGLQSTTLDLKALHIYSS